LVFLQVIRVFQIFTNEASRVFQIFVNEASMTNAKVYQGFHNDKKVKEH